jgi:uncharacterized protein YneF (UPF0154 family)
MKHLPKIILFFILVLVIGIVITLKTIKTSLKEDVKKDNTTNKELVYLLKAEQIQQTV